MSLFLLALACASDPPPPTALEAATSGPARPAMDIPTVPTMLGDVPGVAFLGDWTSAPCAGRAFSRNLRFEKENTYAGLDLVSPCPPNTECAWSGMVAYAGLWKQDGNKLYLREIGAPVAAGSPHPTEVVSTVDGTLLENGCSYTRGLTVPDGSSEDQVRPRVPK